jgi:salicylate hydroxylase
MPQLIVPVLTANDSSNGISNGSHPNDRDKHVSRGPPKPIPTVSYPSKSLQFLQNLRNHQKKEDETEALPFQAKLRLEIVIVGGGLGGLATAVALARRGHSVTVLEQAHELGEVMTIPALLNIILITTCQVGAGIQIPSNSNLLLERWGVTKFLVGKVVEPQGMTFRRWQNGKVIGYTKLVPEFRESFGASYSVVHRADFHDALHQRALQLGVDVRVCCKVVEYDLEAPMVKLSNGELISADLIIAADG